MIVAGPHVNRDHATGTRPPLLAHIKAAAREADAEADFAVRVVAFFVGGPKSRSITLHEDERAPLREWLAATGTLAIAHSSFTAAPWRGDPDAASYIREELRVCASAGVAGLVVHLPKLPVAQVMRYLARLYEATALGVCIYLETPAVKPAESYYETPEKIAALFRAIHASPFTDRHSGEPPVGMRCGICIDTAHLWACGVDLASRADAQEWLDRLAAVHAVVPPAAIMFHLNDSTKPLGGGVDEHAGLCRGEIWGAYANNPEESGLGAIVDYARRWGIPLVLERKPPEALIGDYRVLSRLAASK